MKGRRRGGSGAGMSVRVWGKALAMDEDSGAVVCMVEKTVYENGLKMEVGQSRGQHIGGRLAPCLCPYSVSYKSLTQSIRLEDGDVRYETASKLSGAFARISVLIKVGRSCRLPILEPAHIVEDFVTAKGHPYAMSDSPSKVGPCSPYVEDETDEEFTWEKEALKETEAETDDRICRICFSGQDDADTLGRLISPCKCRYK